MEEIYSANKVEQINDHLGRLEIIEQVVSK